MTLRRAGCKTATRVADDEWLLVTSAASHSTNGNTTNDPKNAITAKRAKPLRGEGQCFCSKAKVAQLQAASKISASPCTHCTSRVPRRGCALSIMARVRSRAV